MDHKLIPNPSDDNLFDDQSIISPHRSGQPGSNHASTPPSTSWHHTTLNPAPAIHHQHHFTHTEVALIPAVLQETAVPSDTACQTSWPTDVEPTTTQQLTHNSLILSPLPNISMSDWTVAHLQYAISSFSIPQLDNHLSSILDLAGFYTYHVLFSSQSAVHLHQFNQGTYWAPTGRSLTQSSNAVCLWQDHP